jgi:hypothetical protein
MPPEIHFHTYSGISIKRVLALRRSVKTITDIPRERMIVKAFFLLNLVVPPSESVPPTITGKSGRMQGASTVRTPAINEIRRSNILIYCKH